MRPIRRLTYDGVFLALWYSPDDKGCYWQDGGGWGDWTSEVYLTEDDAIVALRRGEVTAMHYAATHG